jgi:hypothetical protein
LQVPDSCHDRGTREARGSRHKRNAATANFLSLDRRPLPSPSLVQLDGDKAILAGVIADFAEIAKLNL